MQYRRLGSSGLHLSVLSLGSWVTFHNQVDDKLAIDLMARAYDGGVNFFDNAEVYAAGQSEEIMGRALKKLGWGRDTYAVSSKVFWGGQLPTQRGLSRKHVFDACHAALRRLNVDYLDLYFCHRPDITTPIEETVRAMGDLVAQGKVMYWGTSEWDADQIAEAAFVAKHLGCAGPQMEQPQYNMFHRHRVEREYRRLYDSIGLGTTIWSPLASGLLTGKYRDGIPEGSRATVEAYQWLRDRFEGDEGKERIAKVTELEPIAADLGCSMTQLALAWCAKRPFVSTVILGASKVAQLEENLGAVEVLPKMTDEIDAQIDEILGNRPDPIPRHRD